MGCHHPHPGCPGGCTGVLGDRRIAGMGGTRIVPPFDYPFRHSGHACLKPEAFPQPAKKGRTGHSAGPSLGSDFGPIKRARFSGDPGFHPAISLHLRGREEGPAF
jgi:hypothetical protein